MKTHSFLSLFAALTVSAQGASTFTSSSVPAAAFWSFQSDTSNTTWQSDISRQQGFGGTPTLSFAGSALLTSGTNNGAAFQYDSHTYTGGGETRVAGWQHTGTDPWLNDKSFTLTLNTTGFHDLNIRFDARSAANPSPHTQAPSSYTIHYSIDGGTNWVLTNLPASWTANAAYHEVALDFSSFTDINDQDDVRIRFTLDDGPSSAPGASTTRNVRVDNFLVTAIPEPSAFALSIVGLLFGFRRQRGN
jgi:hypothetical protein